MVEIIALNGNELTIQVIIKLTGSLLEMENTILDSCNSKEERANSHLFITVLAYQFVQLIRRRLKASDSNANSSWRTLREIMSTQCRVTASFRRADGKALHVRKATRAEPEQMTIYHALKVNPAPGGISKTIV